MSHIKVSIIIPVYNGEKYLKECLSCVASQTLKDIEIIIVDSDSTDSTPEIVKSYSSVYANIISIVKTSTMAAARNIGLSIARGEYIMFLDADDFVEIDYCQKLYNMAKTGNYDMVFSSRCDYFDGSSYKYKIWPYDKNSISIKSDNMCEILVNAYKYVVVVWGRIIKKSILIDNNIKFFDNVTTGEDLPVTMLSFLYSTNAYFVRDTYCYYRRNNGITKDVNRVVVGMLEALKILEYELKSRNFSEKIINLSVCIPVVDILIGYFDKWNTGLFSRLSFKTLKKIYPTVKNEYEVFLLNQEVLLNKTRPFRIKYKIFMFSLRHNLYFLPKIVRIARNFIRLLPI